MNNLILGLVILSKYSDDNASYNCEDYVCIATFEDVEDHDQKALAIYGWKYNKRAKCWKFKNCIDWKLNK